MEIIRYESKIKQVNNLKFWNENQEDLPIISKIARKYLGIIGSSAEAERVFSHASNIITKKRNRLNANFVNKLIFLKRN
jgi:hypothetical protein